MDHPTAAIAITAAEPSPDDLLTVDEVAAILRVSTKTLYAWLKAKRLRGGRAGRGWRIRREHVTAFLQSDGSSARPAA